MTATTNLVTNPSFEVNTTGWTNSGLDTCIRATTDSRYGTCCLYIADTVSVASEYVSSPVMAVTAGTTYTASAWIGRSTIADASYTGNFSISWFTGAMAKISEATLALPAGTFPWLRITLTAIAPPTAAYALIYFGDAGITAGSWNLGIDGVQFEAQPAATAYCDGDQPGCAWSGTAHASTSTRTAGAAYTTITITDDTTTLTLTDGRNYALVDQGWAPGVAQLRISTLGGRGPYEDVVEQLTLNVLGETGVEALFNLGELSRMLDQAERWNRGELVAAVKLTYQPQGSVLTTALQCVILGRAGGSAVSNSATFNDLLMCYEISNVQLAFVRRGLWLEAEETLAATSAVANPGIRTGTFASVATIASPAKAVLTFPSDTDVNQYTVLWANNAARIVFLEAETITISYGASTADSTYIARGGSVLRHTPGDLAWHISATSIALPATCRRVAVWAALRNNSGPATWRMRVGLQSYTSTSIYYAPEFFIDGTAAPRIVFIGVISMPVQPLYLHVNLRASTTTGPPTLDIDYFAMLDVTDEKAGVLSANLLDAIATGTAITIDSRPLTGLPAVTKTITAGVAAMSYLGDAYIVVDGSYLAVAYLAVEGNYWCSRTSSAADTYTLTASRWKAHTTPE